MKYRPINDFVLLEPSGADETVGGIIIPATAGVLKRGIVYNVSEGTVDLPMNVNTGDLVLYKKEDGMDVTLDNKQLVLIKQNKLLIHGKAD